MRLSAKPVRKCHACPLNLGDRCWRYRYPRGQWRHDHTCQAFADEALHAEFRNAQGDAQVKTRKELRKEFFRSRKRPVVRRDSGGLW